jgi:dihydrofolate reductase
MRKVASFMMLSVDGYFEGTSPWSIEWHTVDEEFNEFAERQLRASDLLVFGRSTYQGMAQYWPSPEATKDDPVIASLMNSTPKAVVSHTLQEGDVAWANTRLVKDLAELASLREHKGKEMLVLGSSVLTASLLDRNLVDEVRIMVSPTLLGAGSSFAQNRSHAHKLRLIGTRQFRNGNVLLTYAPRRD